MKRFLSLLLTAILLIGVIAVPGVTVSAAEIKTGTLVTFGSYPQSRVTDQSLLDKLDAQPLKWTYYDYYANGGREDYMKYADITYSGARYRAVTFTHYRPYEWQIRISSDNIVNNSFAEQDNNGYMPNRVYWFRYEPVVWRVLDAGAGLMMTEYVLDSQPFHPAFYYDEDNRKYCGDPGHAHLASDWAFSSLRTWMNDDFYNMAFDAEKGLIKETELAPLSDNERFNSDPTKDKVFPLSRADVSNTSYGFSADNDFGTNTNRIAYGTDYAKCQGLFVYRKSGSAFDGASYWRLRDPVGKDGYGTDDVSYDRIVNVNFHTFTTTIGIRPALTVDLESAVSKSLIKTVAAYIPGDIDGNGQILADDARVALRASAQLEKLSAEQMTAADVDGNGQVLADDARQILRFSAKLQHAFDRS